MADSADSRVNLAALKRVDQYAVEIVETGTQVAIYKFNSQSNEWEKTDIEGTLFLYARSGDPKHGFVVMNRLSTENLVEPITKDLEIQLQAPFLLYKNAKFAITGVWFYEESECTRLAHKLESLVKEESTRRRQAEKTSVDILSLLTKAQGEYDQKKGSASVDAVVDVVRPTAVRAVANGAPTNHHSTSLSVADLFATSTEPAASIASSVAPVMPTFLPPPSLPNTELHTAQNLERELRGKLKVSETPPRSGAVASLQQSSSVPLMSPMMFASAAGVVVDNSHVAADTGGRAAGFQTPPVLRCFLKDEPALGGLHRADDDEEEIVPLTKAQLLQAFNYLIKNDPNFVTQLHDAYVQSLKQSLKGSQ